VDSVVNDNEVCGSRRFAIYSNRWLPKIWTPQNADVSADLRRSTEQNLWAHATSVGGSGKATLTSAPAGQRDRRTGSRATSSA
jgi:hypothetical protein